jgi:dienelactone hydrolase
LAEDWLANAYKGMSRRQFLARMSAAGATLAGFAIAANPVAGEVISTPAEGLKISEGKMPSGDFQAPIHAEFVIYPGAPHAFYADYRPSYRANAAKDAWGRCLAWFNKYLKG